MRIAYIHTSSDPGAANVIQVNMMTQALESIENMSVELFVPRIKNSLKEMPFTVEEVVQYPLLRTWSALKYLLGGLKIIKNQRKFGLIYFRNPSFLLPFLFVFRARLVYEIHNNKLSENRFTNILYFALLRLLILAHGKRLKIVVISNNLLNYFKSKLKKNNIQVLHDGIDLETFNPIAKEEACMQVGLDQGTFRICYAGSLKKDRNIEDILAIARANEKFEFLILGGEGEVLETYRRLVIDEQLSNLKFMGRVPHDKVSVYLSASDVLIGLWSRDIPTFNYCSPLKVFEYLAMNRLVLFHELPTIKEITGETAHIKFVGFDSVEDISQALNIFHSKPNNEIDTRSLVINYTWTERAKSALDFR